jgi:DNA-binding transcriptional LysR family regulator
MELRHLRYFIAVAEELNFRHAADRLHVAQPALSRQVRDLEDEVGERLFDRNRRRVLLTDAGRALLLDARGVLASAEAALKTAREVGRGVRGTLRIGNAGRLSAPFLPASLAAFRARFPLVDVELIELDPEDQNAGLLAGTIQVAFQGLSRLLPVDPRLTSRPLMHSEVVVVVPSRHRLAKQQQIRLADLADETFLMFRPREGSAYYERWIRTSCERIGGFTPKLRWPAQPNWDALFGMVAAGGGIGLFPLIPTDEPRGWVGFVAIPFAEPRPDFHVAVVWNSDNRSVILRNYLEMLGSAQPPPVAQ